MASGTTLRGPGWTGVETLRHNWGWFVGLGAALIVLGLVAVTFSFLATLAYTLLFGWLLVVSGALQAAHAFWRKQWRGFFLDLAMGILALVAGFLIVANPVAGAETLTLLIAAFLLVGGIFRIVVALSTSLPHRGWVLVNGVVNTLLGVLIWQQWPLSGLWVIGLFVGIDMLLNGWSLVMLGLMASREPLAA